MSIFSLFINSSWPCTPSMWTSCTTTIITELYSTSTSHWWTSSNSFYPEFTFWTLFKLCSSYKIFKLPVLLTESLTNPVLRTCHSIMIISPALETIMFPTHWTSIIIKRFIILKHSRTTSSWTPWCHIISTLNIFIEWEVIILFHKISINICLNIIDSKNIFTLFHWTFNIKNIRIYRRLDMLMYTCNMKDMLTPLYWCHLTKINISKTNLTLYHFILLYLSFLWILSHHLVNHFAWLNLLLLLVLLLMP